MFKIIRKIAILKCSIPNASNAIRNYKATQR